MIALLVIILEANSLSCYSLLTLQSLIQILIKKMKIDFKNPRTRSTSLTLLFYFSTIILSLSLNYLFPGGMCSPSLGFMLLALLPFISFILFFINFKRSYKGNKATRISTLIHLIVFISFLILYSFRVNR